MAGITGTTGIWSVIESSTPESRDWPYDWSYAAGMGTGSDCVFFSVEVIFPIPIFDYSTS